MDFCLCNGLCNGLCMQNTPSPKIPPPPPSPPPINTLNHPPINSIPFLKLEPISFIYRKGKLTKFYPNPLLSHLLGLKAIYKDDGDGNGDGDGEKYISSIKKRKNNKLSFL